MSVELVTEFARELPPRLREDVIGYARSVQSALPEIFQDAGVAETRDLRDQLVFIAGVKKLYAICSSAFWILDNSLRGLERAEVRQVRLGGVFLARGSREWTRLRDTFTAMEVVLQDQRILPFVYARSYVDILTELANER
jgi:hypothetical protein